MTIQYASDLHLEFPENAEYLKANPLEVVGDILVLAGDTIYLGENMHDADWFFDWCSANYRQTYLIPGNHEYYGGFPMEKTIENYELQVRANVSYLNNKSVVINDTELFFTTLWTNIPTVESYTIEKIMTDCHRNRFNGKRFNSRVWNDIHKSCAEWLVNALSKSTAKNKVVVSHHCPYRNEAGARFVGALAESAYMSDMWPLIEGNDFQYWIHGHIHLMLGSSRGNTIIRSNPLGYVVDGENRYFMNNAKIEI